VSAGVYDHVLDLIGRTPMIRVRGFEEIPDGVECPLKSGGEKNLLMEKSNCGNLFCDI